MSESLDVAEIRSISSLSTIDVNTTRGWDMCNCEQAKQTHTWPKVCEHLSL